MISSWHGTGAYNNILCYVLQHFHLYIWCFDNFYDIHLTKKNFYDPWDICVFLLLNFLLYEGQCFFQSTTQIRKRLKTSSPLLLVHIAWLYFDIYIAIFVFGNFVRNLVLVYFSVGVSNFLLVSHFLHFYTCFALAQFFALQHLFLPDSVLPTLLWLHLILGV